MYKLVSNFMVLSIILFYNPALSATATLYASDGSGNIWTVEVPSGSSNLVGPTSFPRVTDLAFSPTGILFGTTGNDLIVVDPSTGAGTLIGSHLALPGIVVGLDFTPSGILYGTTQGLPGAIVTIDVNTGAATVVLSIPFSGVGDVTVAPDGTLLGTFFPGTLVKIDPASGITTVIGSIPLMSTLDFEPNSGTLFGLQSSGPNVLSVDPSTGVTAVVGSLVLLPRSFGGTFLTTLAVNAVNIDIKPGSDPNCFNANGHGVIPVAILGSSTFDVTLVDLSTLSFGGLEVRVRGNKGPLCNFEDSDGDTILDLVCHFEDDSTNWAPGDGDATLTGTLLDTTTDFEGTDSICVVP